MNSSRHRLFLAGLGAMIALGLYAPPARAEPAPSPPAELTVSIFLSTTCPITNGCAPELGRLHAEWAPRGVKFQLVYVESGITIAQARRHAEEYALRGTILLDPDHRLARALGARVTPEAVVIGPGGATSYRGRIDDRFRELGLRSSSPRHRDLRDALAALLAGRPVPRPRTVAVGCPIE